MAKKQVFIILILIFISGNLSFAADFYPELGLDPFYSSLNPTYTDGVSDNFQEEETVINLIKKKPKDNKRKSIFNIFKKSDDDSFSIDKSNNNDVNFENKIIDKDKTIDNSNTKSSFILQNSEDILIEEDKAKNSEIIEEDTINKNDDLIDKKNTKFSIKDRFSFFKKKKIKEEEHKVNENPQIEFSADYMEYFPERYEVEAIGNANITFTKEHTVLSANKIIYNYDRNILKANENVVLISKDTVTEGDFIRIDLSKPDGWIENPVTKTEDIKLDAKEAFIYSDRIEEYEGVAKILKNETLAFRANSFAAYVDQGGILSNKNNQITPENSGVYSIKAKTIYIDSKKDHDIITIKNADLYLKKYKIASVPSAKIVSNKKNTVVESNIPEIGSLNMLGMHAGPSVVLNVPGGSTLKLSPIITYSKDKIGVGGIARYRNAYNMTEVAYGTSRDELLVRGRQRLAPGLLLNYSRYTNQSEWFLGYRRPKYSANLTYSRRDFVKDLGLHFSQMYSAGMFVDDVPGADFGDAEGRFRWMTQMFKPFYSYRNEEGNIGVNIGLAAQTSASIYTTGDVHGLFRIGPALNTKVGPWEQSIMYLQAAIAGQSPFEFDRYRYGRSNLIFIESLKICKYISIGYLGSLAMNRDVRSDDLFQENRFLVSIGPDYAKLTIGYDAFRQNTMLLLSMLVGTQDSEVKFNKTVIENPQTIGKTVKKKKTKKKNYKKYLKESI